MKVHVNFPSTLLRKKLQGLLFTAWFTNRTDKNVILHFTDV